MHTAEEISVYVEQAISSFRISAVRDWAQSLLVEPHWHLRNWDYGPPGQQFDCWLVARLADGQRGIVYCDAGHGGDWGLVLVNDFWIGPDYCWFDRLEDAFIESGWEGKLPPGYEI